MHVDAELTQALYGRNAEGDEEGSHPDVRGPLPIRMFEAFPCLPIPQKRSVDLYHCPFIFSCKLGSIFSQLEISTALVSISEIVPESSFAFRY